MSLKYTWYVLLIIWIIVFYKVEPINDYIQWNQKIKNGLLYNIKDLINDIKLTYTIFFVPHKIILFLFCYFLGIIWFILSIILLLLSKFIKLNDFWYIYFINFIDIFKKENFKKIKINRNNILIFLNRILIIKLTNFSILFLNIAIVFYNSLLSSKNLESFLFNAWKYNYNYKNIFIINVKKGYKNYTPIQKINRIKITNFKNMVHIETGLENHLIGYYFLKEKINIINSEINENLKISKIRFTFKGNKIILKYYINDPRELLFKNIIQINGWKGEIDDIGEYDYYYNEEEIKKIQETNFKKKNNYWISEYGKIHFSDNKIIFEFEKKDISINTEWIIQIQEDVENKLIMEKNGQFLDLTMLNKKYLNEYLNKIDKKNIKIMLVGRSKLKKMIMIKKIDELIKIKDKEIEDLKKKNKYLNIIKNIFNDK